MLSFFCSDYECLGPKNAALVWCFDDDDDDDDDGDDDDNDEEDDNLLSYVMLIDNFVHKINCSK